ncbi:MAG: sensor histidine kinase, partial [Novosphingobium sp.]|nr:sensor histidine kinase [Novosphingobium sp.]
MQRDAAKGSDPEDLKLLADQVARCRAILRKIGSLGDDGETPFARQSLGELIAEAASPHRDFGVAINIDKHGDSTPEPAWRRSPGILYGLGNIIENAVDFARSRVDIAARWNSETVSITIRDDGRGIPIDILPRLGQPYLSMRSTRDGPAHALDRKGLGLGIFIAKTLLE